MQHEVERTHGNSRVGLHHEIALADTLPDHACWPALLKEKLVIAVALEDHADQFQRVVIGADANIKGHLLHGTDCGKRELIVTRGKQALGAGFDPHFNAALCGRFGLFLFAFAHSRSYLLCVLRTNTAAIVPT